MEKKNKAHVPKEADDDEEMNQRLLMALRKAEDVRGRHYQMEGAAQGCVERHSELAQVTVSSLRKVGTPCLDDHMLAPEDFIEKGVLSKVCSQAV